MDKSNIVSIIITIIEVIAVWRMGFDYIEHINRKQKQLERKNKLMEEKKIFIKNLYINKREA